MIDWKPICRGAIGIEVHGWAGVGVGRDLFHRFARIGMVTIYVSTSPLYRLLKSMKAARDMLRGKGA